MINMEQVLSNIVFYNTDAKSLRNRVFVVSAYAGVTDALLENRKNGAKGIFSDFCEGKPVSDQLNRLCIRLCEINKNFIETGLDCSVANEFIYARIELVKHYLESLSVALASGYLPAESIYSAAREMLASIGESHSAYNMHQILISKGVNSSFVDLGGFEDANFWTIDERIKNAFADVDLNCGIAVATGYCKGTEGIMREFDRGYSEVTFSKTAVALGASEAIIHKEYHLSSADPELVGPANCKVIQQLNYDVADQLADIGMQAIHPKASKPLEIAGIDLIIKNTFQPQHPGTRISTRVMATNTGVDMISGSEKLLIFEILDPLMVGEVGYDERIMSILNRFGISYIMKSTSANSISMVVWEKDFSTEFKDELNRQFQQIRYQTCALLCIIGMSLNKAGILAQAAGVLAKNNIGVLSIGMAFSQVNLQLVLSREDFPLAVKALHKEFFENQILTETAR